MANFGNLVVRLGLDKRQFETGIGSVRSTLGSVATGIAQVTTKIAAYGTAIAAAAAAGTTLLVKESFTQIDALAKMSSRLGIATEDLSRFKHAAMLSGVELEGLGTGLQFMLRNIAKFSFDKQLKNSPFAMLGLDVNQLQRLSVADQFLAIAKAFERIEKPADRVRIAMDLFGRSGATLLPLLNQGASGIAEMVNEAERLGLTISTLDAAQVEAANDSFETMKSSIVGLTNEIAIGLAPAVTAFGHVATGVFASLRPAIGDLIGDTRELGLTIFETVENMKLIAAAFEMQRAGVPQIARQFALNVLKSEIDIRRGELLKRLDQKTPRPVFGEPAEDINVNQGQGALSRGPGGRLFGLGLAVPGIAAAIQKAVRPRGEPGTLPGGSLRGSQDALNKIARAQNSVEAKSLNVQQQQLAKLDKIEKKLPANKGNEIAIGMFGGP